MKMLGASLIREEKLEMDKIINPIKRVQDSKTLFLLDAMKYRSAYGMVCTGWKFHNLEYFTMYWELPPNTQAQIFLPDFVRDPADAESISITGVDKTSGRFYVDAGGGRRECRIPYRQKLR